MLPGLCSHTHSNDPLMTKLPWSMLNFTFQRYFLRSGSPGETTASEHRCLVCRFMLMLNHCRGLWKGGVSLLGLVILESHVLHSVPAEGERGRESEGGRPGASHGRGGGQRAQMQAEVIHMHVNRCIVSQMSNSGIITWPPWSRFSVHNCTHTHADTHSLAVFLMYCTYCAAVRQAPRAQRVIWCVQHLCYHTGFDSVFSLTGSSVIV